MSIPYLQFYYDTDDSLSGVNIKYLMAIQIVVNLLYQIDLLILILTKGLTTVLFDSPTYIYLEFIAIPAFYNVCDEMNKTF